MSFKDMSKVLQDPENFYSYFIKLVAGSAMPGGIRQLRGVVDPIRRRR